jgi:hypothetical protein
LPDRNGRHKSARNHGPGAIIRSGRVLKRQKEPGWSLRPDRPFGAGPGRGFLVFNALTDTALHGLMRRPSALILIIRGFAQGVPTAQLARELGRDRSELLNLRHRLQDLGFKNRVCGSGSSSCHLVKSGSRLQPTDCGLNCDVSWTVKKVDTVAR